MLLEPTKKHFPETVERGRGEKKKRLARARGLGDFLQYWESLARCDCMHHLGIKSEYHLSFSLCKMDRENVQSIVWV